mgnify:FL=1
MNIGILGSSFSVGCHHNPDTKQNDLALPFEHWLEKYLPEHNFYNSACSGKGSELYLNKIVYLKKHYNIDAVLLELVNNRSMLNVKTQEYDLEIINDELYRDSSSIWDYVTAITQPIDFKKFCTAKEFVTWKDVQEQIAYSFNAFEFWGILDCKQTIELCDMLGIKVITWQKSFDFRKHIPHDVDFGVTNAHEYYVNKYDSKSILCDHVHFKDEINDEMVKDFIAPAILRTL